VVVIDDLLQVTHLERSASNLINLETLLLFLVVLRLKALLVLNELLLHQDIVLYTFLAQQTETTLAVRSNYKS